MNAFLSALFSEMGARRRRLRAALGDRGQALAEFLVLGGLFVGSVGLYVRPWMPAASPWGFWIPAVFILGALLIEIRRQSQIERGAAPEALATAYDWLALLWSFGCALAGAAAFIVAWSAEPAPPPQTQGWAPPENTVSVDISP
jgi:hypothetical protein